MSDILFIDMEYNRSCEADMGLVSLAINDGTAIYDFWLRDPVEMQAAKDFLANHKGATLVGYAIELAEARCVCAMGIDPMDYQWEDLMLNWRWLKNGDDRWVYGKIIVKGRIITSVAPPHEGRLSKKATKEEREAYKEEMADWAESQGAESASQGKYSLMDALVFFGVIDQQQFEAESGIKDFTRQVIIAGGDLEPMRKNIIKYNRQDTEHMPELWRAQHEAMAEALASPHIVLDGKIARGAGYDIGFVPVPSVPIEGGTTAVAHMLGEWAARCAKYASRGLPINPQRWANIMRNAPKILEQIKDDFNANWFPRYEVDDGGLAERDGKMVVPDSDDVMDLGKAWAKRVGSLHYPYTVRQYTESYLLFENWARQMEETYGFKWKLTESGKLAKDKEYMESLATDSDNCPFKAFSRCSKEIDAVRGLSKTEKGLPQTVGSDFIHRYAVDPWATQTARNGQGASRFLYSAPHWMRALIDPPQGKVILDFDFGSQEVIIGAVLSGDENSMRGYESGDPYWTFAQLTGAIPNDLRPPLTDHEKESSPWKEHMDTRKAYKAIYLGIGFGMGAAKLALSLTKELKRPVEKDEAKDFINQYKQAYPVYTSYRETLQELYQESDAGMMLSDGWRMGPDNPSPNSYLNLPVQGHGSVILRKACRMLDDAGIIVIATMHDAITVICDETDMEKVEAQTRQIMLDASEQVLGIKGMKVGATEVVRHGEIWLHERGKKAWPRFKAFVI